MVLAALCAALMSVAFASAASAKAPVSPCKTAITPAFIKAITGVTVTVNTKLPDRFDPKTGSAACHFTTATAVNNAIELNVTRFPVGSKSAAGFWAAITKASATWNLADCQAHESAYPDPLPEDCVWTPVAGPWKTAAVGANQMWIQFPHAIMTLMTGGQKPSDPDASAPKRTFTYDQMIAVAKAAVAKLKP
jgi:hypothetical protein